MKKIIALLMTLCLCLTLAACGGSSAISLVKNGELLDYPDKPVAETFQEYFEEEEFEVEESWEDITEEWSDLLAALEGEHAAVQCVYNLDYTYGTQEVTIIYIVDLEDESFFIYSYGIDGEVTTNDDEIEYMLNEIFG